MRFEHWMRGLAVGYCFLRNGVFESIKVVIKKVLSPNRIMTNKNTTFWGDNLYLHTYMSLNITPKEGDRCIRVASSGVSGKDRIGHHYVVGPKGQFIHMHGSSLLPASESLVELDCFSPIYEIEEEEEEYKPTEAEDWRYRSWGQCPHCGAEATEKTDKGTILDPGLWCPYCGLAFTVKSAKIGKRSSRAVFPNEGRNYRKEQEERRKARDKKLQNELSRYGG